MTATPATEPIPRKPLRLWPGVIVAVIAVLLRFVVPRLVPEAAMYGLLGAMVGFALILLWWLFFSRAPWVERVGAIVVMIGAGLATTLVLHESLAGGVMRGVLPMIAFPVTLGPAFVAWAVLTRRLPDRLRRATMAATIVLACGVWALVRNEGVKGGSPPQGGSIMQLKWRWTPTAEERLLAQEREDPKTPYLRQGYGGQAAAPETAKEPNPAAAAEKTVDSARDKTPAAFESPAAVTPPPLATKSAPADPVPAPAWPGFRGPNRDGVVRGVTVDTDWTKSPPVQMWRRPIGPGWSSFAVAGDLLYTQEQRGDDEVIGAYKVSTGEPVWRHRDPVRFYEPAGGAGPRGTPAVHNGRVYALGTTGILNALDARTGAVVWSRNASKDTGASMPDWGFASSPLVVGDLLVVATSGRLGAFELATGKPRWTRATGGGGYSSPHLYTVDGVTHIVLLTGRGATGVSPADGTVLWDHFWKAGTAIVQPAILPDGQMLMALGGTGGEGMRRLGISRDASGWNVTERWTSRGLKPYYNDFVVHKGHAFGFDGAILSCINVETGERKWKGGRYGAGQMVLLREQDLLLVVSEDGELALVAATPDKHTELAKFKAIDGKTWNHPVLVGHLLLVRNGEEMAAFRLPSASH